MGRVRVEIGAPSTAEDRERLQDIFASRQCPGTRGTDRAFLQGDCNGSQFSHVPKQGDALRKKAIAAGVNPVGKKYIGGIARRFGDPRAWISSVSELKAIAEERNLNMTGIVEREACEVEPKPSIGLAPKIVNREVNKIIAREPEKARKREQLEAEVRDKHTPKWKKGVI